MRIVMFQDTYHPATNGVVVSTDLFIEELKRRGHDVLLIAPRHPDYTETAPEGVHLIPAVSTEFIYPGASLGQFWRGKVGPLLEAFQPDIMHSMTEFTIGHWMASYFREKFHLKRVHTFHTLWTEYFFYLPLVPHGLVNKWFQWAAPRSCRKRFDHVLVPSEAMRETVVNDWHVDVPVDVLPTGLHLEKFRGGVGERFRQHHGISDDTRVLLYLGRLGDEKNVELVVDAMAELRRRGEPNVKLVIAGGGPDPYLRKLHKRCEGLGLKDVIWTGFVRGQDWLDTYAAADLVLFPSVTETQGLVVVESLAVGKPLVSVEAMGPGSVMKGEKGCLFAENDARDFADKTQRLLHDDVLYQRKKREAAEVAQSYSIEQRGEELEALYHRVLGRAPVELFAGNEPVSAEPRRPQRRRWVV